MRLSLLSLLSVLSLLFLLFLSLPSTCALSATPAKKPSAKPKKTLSPTAALAKLVSAATKTAAAAAAEVEAAADASSSSSPSSSDSSTRSSSSVSPPSSPPSIDPKLLWCAVCESAVDTIDHLIATTPVTHTVQTRWRIDEKRRIPYARTEHRLLEIMETEATQRMALHGLYYASHTASSRPRLLLPPAGDPSVVGTYARFTANPMVSRSVSVLYEDLIDRYLDELLPLFHHDGDGDEEDGEEGKHKGKDKGNTRMKQKVCVEMSRMCARGTDFSEVPVPEMVPPPPTPPPPPPSQPTAAEQGVEAEAGVAADAAAAGGGGGVGAEAVSASEAGVQVSVADEMGGSAESTDASVHVDL